MPADTLFSKAKGGWYDAVVAMYHDQGHIPTKFDGFIYDHQTQRWAMQGVNVTLGLPIIRTSVDHGTAFGKAGKGTADQRSLLEAVQVCDRPGSGERRVIVVLADDLAGAAEMGGMAWRHGLSAEVRTGAGLELGAEGAPGADVDVRGPRYGHALLRSGRGRAARVRGRCAVPGLGSQRRLQKGGLCAARPGCRRAGRAAGCLGV